MKWFREQITTITVILLLSIGILLYVLGYQFSNAELPLIKFLSNVAIPLSGTLIVAAFATVFFSLHDVIDLIARTTSRLITSGEVIPILSDESKEILEQKIVLDRLSKTINGIEPSLYIATTSIRNKCLSTFHLNNFFEQVTIYPYKKDNRFAVRESVRTYKVFSHHLTMDNKKYELSSRTELTVPAGMNFEKNEIVKRFEVRAGDTQFSEIDATFDVSSCGSTNIFIHEFNRKINIDKELDIRICTTYLFWANDNVNCFCVKYPTNGFRISLSYQSDMQYDAAWFRAREPGSGFEKDTKNIQATNSGLTMHSNDWLLPGDGIVVIWHPVGAASSDETMDPQCQGLKSACDFQEEDS